MSEVSAIENWVETAPAEQRELREAVHVILRSISRSSFLRAEMVMKGGILMAIRYHSPRFTTDIDFSSNQPLSHVDVEMVRAEMDSNLAVVSQELTYGLDCRVQSCGINPKGRPDASFPSIELKIGHAYRGTPKHKRLSRGQSSSVVSIDFSLNETILAVEDLVAEKLRSLLQQVVRDRFRRQDVYDICRLLEQPMGDEKKAKILRSLIEKSTSRDITPNKKSISEAEVKRRAKKDYLTLADEVEGELPDFEASYALVVEFYESLPWGSER